MKMLFSNLNPVQTLSRYASIGCILWVCVLAGCGGGGPDDPATIQALKDLGVLVVPNAEGNINGLNNLPTDANKLTEAINLSAKLRSLKTINVMPGIPLTDDHMGTIGGNGNLVQLSIHEAAISDAGVAKLTGCKKLESLSLIGTGVTSDALAPLGKLSKLNMLNLNDTKVSGGFEALQSCPNLQWILIGGLEISDEDAAAIAKIPALSHVTRTGSTKISEAAIKTLKSVKNCNVDVVGE